MIREVDLVSYLPPFMQEYETLVRTLAAEEPEFVLLWKAAERVLKNEFITTADEYGIARFEKILHIFPEKEETLEERRTKLLMKYNLSPPYTFPFLKTMLASIVGDKNYTIERLYELYQIKIYILNQSTRQAKNIYMVINSLIPENMQLLLYAEYREAVKIEVKQATRIEFQMKFHPRANLPELSLDDTWILDGSQTLSGYDGFGQIDLYPVGIDLQTMVKVKPKEETGIVFTSKAIKSIRSGQEMGIKISAAVDKKIKESITVQASAAVNTGVGDIIVDNLNYLDGGWELDGSRELNGGIYQL